MRRTKIVCTIGPASESPERIRALIDAGLNVARLNMSHGDLNEHARRIKIIREEEARSGKPIAILLDIQGPKIRIGEVPGSPRPLSKGEGITLTVDPNDVQGGNIFVPYANLPNDLAPGRVVFLDDGLIELKVDRIDGPRVECSAVIEGDLKSRKGLTLPGVTVDLPPLDEQDKEHILFGVEQGVDYVAASFVRKAEHVEAVRRVINDCGGLMPVIAKIESEEGVRRIDEIIEAADGVMVARGDLGIELPPEEVPLVQKRLIEKCNMAGKPVITATQMLDSMARNPRPTRAEVTDVANAILDGTDAVMLSGETAVGKYPVEAVSIMHKVALRTEEAVEFGQLLQRQFCADKSSVAEAIACATCDIVYKTGGTAILCSTQSGATARMVSKYRPHPPIIAVTPNPHVARQLPLIWGVYPVLGPCTDNTDDMMDVAISAALKSGLVKPKDTVAVAAGVRTDRPGSTNMLQVHVVEARGGEIKDDCRGTKGD